MGIGVFKFASKFPFPLLLTGFPRRGDERRCFVLGFVCGFVRDGFVRDGFGDGLVRDDRFRRRG